MPTKLSPIHPGEILKDAMDDAGLTMNQLAKALDVPPNRITAIISGTRGITAETALRLAAYFDTTPEYWMNMQMHYELQLAQARETFDIKKLRLTTAKDPVFVHFGSKPKATVPAPSPAAVAPAPRSRRPTAPSPTVPGRLQR